MDNKLAALEDIRSLFNENQEKTVNSVQVSNFNSNFFSNQDYSFPQPITVIHPTTLEIINTGETGKGEEEAKVVEELRREVLVVENVREEGGIRSTENEVSWEAIVEMVQNMGFCLVPSEQANLQEDRSISGRKKQEKRELRNLRFGVNFKESEYRRGTFNSK